MEIKGDIDGPQERPTSPLWVLHQISEEAVRVANEYLGSANTSPVWTGHKRSQSEVAKHTHQRSNSFQTLKSQISKAWRWGGNSQYENGRFNFNPEVLANQKRQWYQLHTQTQDRTKYQDPTSLFEHFIITGLHPDANLEAVEDAFARRKKWEAGVAGSNEVDKRSSHHCGPSPPVLEPQILFKYPPGKRLPLRLKELCAFTFPGGVKARLMERTPSLSDLNSLVYGQEHMGRDDLAFVFSLKAADNGTLYGICLHVPEIVQRPPAILGSLSPLCNPSLGGSRFMVSAPRCYCLLTRVPFFELHYEMLNSIISQERLNRITQFVTEMSLCNYSPSPSRLQFGNIDSPARDTEWMSSAIPVDSAIALTAAAAGLITDDEVPSVSPKTGETHSPSSEASECSLSKEVDQDGKRNLQDSDDLASDASESWANGFGRPYENCENGSYSPEATLSSHSDVKLERSNSSLSLYSSVRSMDEDDCFSNQDSDCSSDFMTMEWAKDNKNDLLQIVCAYSALPVPQRGDEVVFQPLEHLQAIQYKRFSVLDLGINGSKFDRELSDPIKSAEVNARLAAAEEATALSVWTTATICRVLSLESILALLNGVLLEKQVVVVGSNMGVLSSVVLSIIPMIRPFEWQSLFLSILPAKMLDFLDAPVPYIVGIKNKPAELKIKTSNLVLVNVAKDQVKTCSLPLLPRRKDLYSELRPLHSALAGQSRMAEKNPVYRCNEEQVEAAARFSDVMRRYMESLCADLRSYTITSVQSNNDRVSLLLKDSFIDSFSSRDRPFIKLFVDTQMFTVLSDSRLATFEHEKS